MFPVSGSLLAAPPFPRSGPGEPGSPTSAVLRGRYDFPPTHLPVAYWFALGPHAILLQVRARRGRRSRTAGGAVAGQDHWSAGDPHCRRLAHGREWDLSGSQAILPVPLPRSRTPAGPTSPRHGGLVDAAPAPFENKGSSVTTISRLTAGLWHLLSTLHERRCRHPCKTRFRLAGSPLPGGRRTLWTAMKGFRVATSLSPFLS